MQGRDWGILYNHFGKIPLDPKTLEKQIVDLIQEGEITNKKDIYANEQQKGICVMCGGEYKYASMQAGHITPWSKGGRTTVDNCQILCTDCNRRKSNI